MRSRRPGEGRATGDAGITSACAEQTFSFSARSDWIWDHLRVCGADGRRGVQLADQPGSPPRVRSRLAVDAVPGVQRRITSACAEQTSLGIVRIN